MQLFEVRSKCAAWSRKEIQLKSTAGLLMTKQPCCWLPGCSHKLESVPGPALWGSSAGTMALPWSPGSVAVPPGWRGNPASSVIAGCQWPPALPFSGICGSPRMNERLGPFTHHWGSESLPFLLAGPRQEGSKACQSVFYVKTTSFKAQRS